MYSSQLLDGSQGRVGVRMAVGAREEIGGSVVEFAGCDYEIAATIEAVIFNEFLLLCHLIV